MTDERSRDPEQQHEATLQGPQHKGAGIGRWVAHRAKPYVPPWLMVPVTGGAGALASLAWEGEPWPAVGLTLTSVALTGATWVAAKATGTARRLHATVTVACASAWLTAAAVAGPLAGPVPSLFGMGGPALALSWNIRQAMRRNPDVVQAAGDGSIKEAIGLAKAKLGKPKVEPNKVTVPYELEAGQTHEHAVKALKPMASATDVPVNAVRHAPDGESARRGDFVFVPVDMLKEVTWYPGPSHLGGSIADPLIFGVYDNGDPLMLTVPEALHMLIMGITGSGKTEAAISLLAEILTRRDVIVWLSDPKHGQDLGASFAACDWVVQDAAAADLMIEALRRVIPARQQWLGEHGYRAWEPAAAEVQDDPAHSCATDGTACGCPGMPFLVSWFEEAANTLAANGDDAFTTIAQEARSAGVWLVVSMQRASGYQISTDTRASLPAALCFGVDERDASFALPGDVLDAGANPGSWGGKYPGYCYLVAKGVIETLWPTPGRTFRNDPVTLEAVRDRCAPLRMAVDPVTEKAAAAVVGVAYTNRPRPDRGSARVADAIRNGALMPTDGEAGRDSRADAAPTPYVNRMTYMDDMGADDGDQDGEGEGGAGWVDAEHADIDPSAELPANQSGDDAPVFGGDTGRKPEPEEGRRLFAAALDEFEAAGQMIVQPKDFLDWADRHHLSRSWVSLRLGEAARRGRIEPTGASGKYRIVPTPVGAS